MSQEKHIGMDVHQATIAVHAESCVDSIRFRAQAYNASAD
jgi:hypothetical protein